MIMPSLSLSLFHSFYVFFSFIVEPEKSIIEMLAKYKRARERDIFIDYFTYHECDIRIPCVNFKNENIIFINNVTCGDTRK